MKTLRIIGLVALILIIAVLGIRFLSGPEDNWICQNGQWVKHGNPSAPQPTVACGRQKRAVQYEILVDRPLANQVISSPLVVEGQARGSWFFEASFPIELRDINGKMIAQSVAQAKGDWMTTEYVPFEATLIFPPALCAGLEFPCSVPAVLIFKKDNPSGLPQYDAQIEIPVRISEQLAASTVAPGTKVKAFFNNDKLDPEYSCNKVFPVEREILKTTAMARAALEELLRGPTAAEKAEGFFTSINPGVKIQKLVIEQGVAKVDFDQTMEQGMGGSCRVSAIRAQITATFKQFPTVEDVIISVNGRTEDILQP